jgi:hypothetical protein
MRNNRSSKLKKLNVSFAFLSQTYSLSSELFVNVSGFVTCIFYTHTFEEKSLATFEAKQQKITQQKKSVISVS